MSQTTAMTGVGEDDGRNAVEATGRAVLLLAIAVVLGAALLSTLDTAPEGTTLSGRQEAVSTPAPSNGATPVTDPAVTLPAPRSPAEVKVLVANGVGVSGAASKVAGRLQPAGYQLLKPGNTVNREINSLVEFAPGFQAEAQVVATSLGLPASSVLPLPATSPVTDLQGMNVLVIVGNDLANAAQTQAAPTLGSGAANAVNPALNGPLSQLSGGTPATVKSPTGTQAGAATSPSSR